MPADNPPVIRNEPRVVQRRYKRNMVLFIGKSKVIEYASVFDAHRAHRIIEKKTGRKIKRDHKLGSLKFEIPDEYYQIIKRKIDYYTIKDENKASKIEFVE